MNFASKKLSGFYANTPDISAREKVLLAENKKLKRKNKRLSTAMLYLVDQIEIKLPLWSGKKTEQTTPAHPEPKLSVPVAPPRPAKKKIVGKAWTPEKIDHIPGVASGLANRSQPMSIQQIFSEKKIDRPSTSSVEATEEPKKQPPIVANRSEKIEIASPVSEEHSPVLAPEEVSLLAAPKIDSDTSALKGPSSEQLVKRENKVTSAKEASLTYLAVSIASAPVPEAKDREIDDAIEHQVAVQNDIMREAMLRRANRLRW